MKPIKFVQGSTKSGILPFEKTFESFDEVREWILEDKREGYGDILSFGGKFEGLNKVQETELKNLTLEDAMK